VRRLLRLGERRRQRGAAKLTHGKLKKNALKASATLLKLYDCPKKAREELYKLPSQKSVKNALILVMLVVPTLMRACRPPHLSPPAAAATSLF
jgi:hypothetical protein